jgi:hypothetical protein
VEFVDGGGIGLMALPPKFGSGLVLVQAQALARSFRDSRSREITSTSAWRTGMHEHHARIQRSSAQHRTPKRKQGSRSPQLTP